MGIILFLWIYCFVLIATTELQGQGVCVPEEIFMSSFGKDVNKSTLSRANENWDWRIF